MENTMRSDYLLFRSVLYFRYYECVPQGFFKKRQPKHSEVWYVYVFYPVFSTYIKGPLYYFSVWIVFP